MSFSSMPAAVSESMMACIWVDADACAAVKVSSVTVTPSWTEAVSGTTVAVPTPETETVAVEAPAAGVASWADAGCNPAKRGVARIATAPNEASLRNERDWAVNDLLRWQLIGRYLWLPARSIPNWRVTLLRERTIAEKGSAHELSPSASSNRE